MLESIVKIYVQMVSMAKNVNTNVTVQKVLLLNVILKVVFVIVYQVIRVRFVIKSVVQRNGVKTVTTLVVV